MSTWLVFCIGGAVYAFGWARTAVTWALASAETPFCHSENSSKYKFSRGYCQLYCRPGCARGDEPDYFDAIEGCLVALFWPLLLLPDLVLRSARRKPSRSSLEKQIADMERELGMSA